MSGVADLRKVYEEAKARRRTGQTTLLFIDEIHRFNRAQQDGLLAQVEDGTVTLIGATTENPSFALTGALMSRCQVLVLNRLDHAALAALIARAERAIGHELPLDAEARARLIELADGDGRYLLNMVENLADLPAEPRLDPAALAHVLQRRMPLYDRQQEAHYNLISALHKSVRGSDPDAALYWLARMLGGGEDPRYIARRLVRMASEDVGLADPAALPLAIAASHAYEQLGSPEGELALAECALYLACAPKSNAVYRAFGEATRVARESGSLMPPMHILNAPTRLMRDLGYGQRLRVRPRRARSVLRPGLLPRGPRAADLLPSDRRGGGGGAERAPRALRRAAPQARGLLQRERGRDPDGRRRRGRGAAGPLVPAALPGDRARPPATAAAHGAGAGGWPARAGECAPQPRPAHPHPAAAGGRSLPVHGASRLRARGPRRCRMAALAHPVRGPRAARARQAGRSRGPGRHRDAPPRRWHAAGLGRAASGRASSIAWIAIPAGCWWSPRRRPRRRA